MTEDPSRCPLNSKMVSKDYLYHYTSEYGKEGIAVSNFIAPSTRRRLVTAPDEGVHFTDLPPTADMDLILSSCYGDTGPTYRRKAEYFVRVRRDQVTVTKETKSDGRVAYVHFGAGLNLRNIEYQCGKVGAGSFSWEGVSGSEWGWLTVAGGAVGAVALVLLMKR